MSMFSKKWKTSERKYEVLVERDVKIRMSDGVELNADIFRPKSDGKFPAIVSMNPYTTYQAEPIKPVPFGTFREGRDAGTLEAGDPNFYVRRGYSHIIVSIRGTGKSGGTFQFLSPREIQDVYEVIEWAAQQPWCNGNVGMFGASYFAWIQLFVAALNPPHLKCIFAPWAATDLYRDLMYHGGIMNIGFSTFPKFVIGFDCWPFSRQENWTRKKLGEEGLKKLINEVLQDEDIARQPVLVEILTNPDKNENQVALDIILHQLYDEYWEERTVKYENIKVPAYIGACWGTYGWHLPGTFRSWENLKVPKKMILCPPYYLDRPVYQLAYESLRWFDYWLKGIDTGIMDEPPIKIFVMNTGEWKETYDWPLPETKWTPFFLHENSLLSEHEFWHGEGGTSFEDSPYRRESVEFYTPKLVDNVEVIGPIVLNIYASTTSTDIFWHASLLEIDPQGNKKVITRGWLRGSQRAIDPERSKLWAPYHPHTKREPLEPGKIYEFNIPIVPTAILFRAGSRIGLRISCVDDDPKTFFDYLAGNHIRRQHPARITIHHNAEYPSHLLLPITKGNIMGTFLSGGEIPPLSPELRR
ncbi:MAG: CocE/NonD family hydrolase [Candidatus Bathyarchaeia archaeon]